MVNSTCIKLKTVDQRLTIVQQPILASGDVGTVRVEYLVDHYWDGYIISGTFYTSAQPDDVYEQPLKDGACEIPWEVLTTEGILNIGLRGVDGTGLVKTAAPVRYRIEKGSPSGTDTTTEPTPDVYQQILSTATNAEEIAQSVRDDADAGAFNGFSVSHEWDDTVLHVTSASGTTSADLKGEKGDTGETGSVGPQGPPGENGKDGYTPVKGTDYLTETEVADLESQVLSAVTSAIGTPPRIEMGYYVGTGDTYPEDAYSNSLTFGFTPKLWGIYTSLSTPKPYTSKPAYLDTAYSCEQMILPFPSPDDTEVDGDMNYKVYAFVDGSSGTMEETELSMKYSGNTVTWYYSGDETDPAADMQFNATRRRYYYFAIG